MAVFRQCGCIWAKWMYSGKSGSIRAKWLYLGKSGCIRAKVALFKKRFFIRVRWLYSRKTGCFRAELLLLGKGILSGKLVVFWQGVCIPTKWWNSGKVVVFEQNLFYSGKSGCNPAIWFYSGKGGCIRRICLF